MVPEDYAKVIREIIQHENELAHQRITWMVTLNGLLFTGLGLVWGKAEDKAFIFTVSALGMVVGLSTYTSLYLGGKAVMRLQSLWAVKAVSETDVPPVRGWERMIRFAPYSLGC